MTSNDNSLPSCLLAFRKRIAFTLTEAFSPHCAGRCKAAFTLAEVLITLGIIGVVAALTIPGLIANVDDKAFDTQRKAATSRLAQATGMMLASDVLQGVQNADELVENMRPYLKIIKVCGKDDLNSCFVDEVKTGNVYNLLGFDLSQPAYAESDINFNDNVKISSLSLTPTYDTKSTADLRGVVTADGTAMLLGYVPNCETNPSNVQNNGTESKPVLPLLSYLRNMLIQPAYAMSVQGPGNIGEEINESSSFAVSDNRKVAPIAKDERACVVGLVDTNGKKKPNTIGKDVFFYQAQDSTQIILQSPGQSIL